MRPLWVCRPQHNARGAALRQLGRVLGEVQLFTDDERGRGGIVVELLSSEAVDVCVCECVWEVESSLFKAMTSCLPFCLLSSSCGG